MHARFPWQAKLASKVIAANLGVPYTFWRRHGIFKLGAMLDPNYARSVYEHHVGHANPTAKTLLELGPGDSLFTAVYAYTRFERSVLIDAGPFAETDPHPYIALVDQLRSKGERMLDVPEDFSWASLLSALHCTYLTDGVASLSELNDSEMDFSFSHSCLQHIPLDQFKMLARELYRVTADGGTGSHLLDFRDMLAGSLNHLRFSSATWESSFVKNTNVYTNRLRLGQIREAFEEAGFRVEILEQKRWDVLPVSRARLNRGFRSMEDEELLSYGAHLLVRKP
ncbi:hypothetical protein [Caballeronia sp. RCC_10]|uniref:hypothetical protein n=1 Tax=Caballeronia sp. RCC_10 TaxID=3239227 RepID=UPI0035241305